MTESPSEPILDLQFHSALRIAKPYHLHDPEDLEAVLLYLSGFDTRLDDWMRPGTGYDGINFYFRAVEAVYHDAISGVMSGFYQKDAFTRHNEALWHTLTRITETKYPTPEIQNVYNRCPLFFCRVRDIIEKFTTPTGQLQILDPDNRYPLLADRVKDLDGETVTVAPGLDKNTPQSLTLWSPKYRGQHTITNENEAIAWVRSRR